MVSSLPIQALCHRTRCSADQVEDLITRLKLVKRQMYGRANLAYSKPG